MACETNSKNWAIEIQEGCTGGGSCAVASGACTGAPAAAICTFSGSMESATECPAGCLYAGKDTCENTGNTWVEGSADTGGACVRCAAGSEPNAAQSTCVACGTGTYSAFGVSCIVCVTPSVVIVAEDSNGAQVGCGSCPPGRVTVLDPTTERGVCTSCELGKEPSVDQSSCENCGPTETGDANNDGMCVQCGPGMEPNEGQTACVPCSPNYFSTVGACVQCPPGQTNSSVESIECEDIDECAVNNGDCDPLAFTPCVNTDGGRDCGDCPPDYEGSADLLDSSNLLEDPKGCQLIPPANNSDNATMVAMVMKPVVVMAVMASESVLEAGSEQHDFIESLTSDLALSLGIDPGLIEIANLRLANAPGSAGRRVLQGVDTVEVEFDVIFITTAGQPIRLHPLSLTKVLQQQYSNTSSSLWSGNITAAMTDGQTIAATYQCPAATYHDDGDVCRRCPAGFQPSPDHVGCQACNAVDLESVASGRKSSWAGYKGTCTQCESGKTPSQDSIMCVPCPAGKAGVDGLCEACTAGQEPSPDAQSCIDCSSRDVAGQQYFMSTSQSPTRCEQCPPGSQPVANRSGCEACVDTTTPHRISPNGGPCEGKSKTIYDAPLSTIFVKVYLFVCSSKRVHRAGIQTVRIKHVCRTEHDYMCVTQLVLLL